MDPIHLPEGVTWDIFDEYSMDKICPEGVKEIGLEAMVRAKAIELCYTSQTLMDMSDRIMNALPRDLDGNIVGGPRVFPPSFPRLEFEGDAMRIVQEPSQPQQEEKREAYVVLNWKEKHSRSVYAVPVPQAQSYMHQILTLGPLQARFQRQRDQVGRDHLATTLADEIPQCIVVSLDTEWEVRKDTLRGPDTRDHTCAPTSPSRGVDNVPPRCVLPKSISATGFPTAPFSAVRKATTSSRFAHEIPRSFPGCLGRGKRRWTIMM